MTPEKMKERLLNIVIEKQVKFVKDFRNAVKGELFKSEEERSDISQTGTVIYNYLKKCVDKNLIEGSALRLSVRYLAQFKGDPDSIIDSFLLTKKFNNNREYQIEAVFRFLHLASVEAKNIPLFERAVQRLTDRDVINSKINLDIHHSEEIRGFWGLLSILIYETRMNRDTNESIVEIIDDNMDNFLKMSDFRYLNNANTEEYPNPLLVSELLSIESFEKLLDEMIKQGVDFNRGKGSNLNRRMSSFVNISYPSKLHISVISHIILFQYMKYMKYEKIELIINRIDKINYKPSSEEIELIQSKAETEEEKDITNRLIREILLNI